MDSNAFTIESIKISQMITKEETPILVQMTLINHRVDAVQPPLICYT